MSKLVVTKFEHIKHENGKTTVVCNAMNNTDKIIKYAIFWVTPYNAVNDPLECSISGKSKTGLKFTGPVEPGKGFYEVVSGVWYNHEIRGIGLSAVDLIYMDGTEEKLSADKIEFSKPKGGCYVATCVYDSYDCPQVWTLRRFRDNTLAATWYGRSFVRIYYAISPILVKWFGNTAWFKNLWKPILDHMVENLNASGIEDIPYNDKEW